MPGKCSFQTCWLDKPEFKEWLARVPGDTCSAACKICRKNFSVSSLGVTAVTSHANGKKHKQGELFVFLKLVLKKDFYIKELLLNPSSKCLII